jgi:hypothetical protein
MPRILESNDPTFLDKDKAKFEKVKDFFTSKWEWFKSLDKFTRLLIVFTILISVSISTIGNTYLSLRSRAAEKEETNSVKISSDSADLNKDKLPQQDTASQDIADQNNVNYQTASSGKSKVATFFIFSNLHVCVTPTNCLQLTLTTKEVDKIKKDISYFKSDVNKWLHGKMTIVPKIVNTTTEYTVTASKDGYGGYWLAPSDVRSIIIKQVTSSVDFVYLIHGDYDIKTKKTLKTSVCDLTDSADNGSIGTSYTWIPHNQTPNLGYDCANKKVMDHGLLHQIDFDLEYINNVPDIYRNTYTKAMCGNTKVVNNYKWFPDPDQADKIPDFPACKKYYNSWSKYCDSIAPVDCDYKFDQHLLKAHFPPNLNFIGNHCHNNKQDFDEYAIDKGYSCNTSNSNNSSPRGTVLPKN